MFAVAAAQSEAGSQAAHGGGPRARRRPWACPTFLLAGIVALSAQQLPDLPQVDTSNFLPVIRSQIERAEREAAEHPRDAHAAGVLGMTLHAYDQDEAARRAYQRAHLLDPQQFDWLYLLGAVDMGRGDFDAAVRAFRPALELRPGDLAAQVRLAQSLAAMGSWVEAGVVYGRILEAHPGCAQAWYGLGRVEAAKGDHASAAAAYARACELFPAYGAAHFALAGELRRSGKPAEAEQHLAAYKRNVTAEPPLEDPLFERIHELNRSVRARLERGAALDRAGELDAAIREHLAALDADPNSVQAHVNLISLYARTGNAAAARQHFDAAIRLNPGRSDAWYDYGVLLIREKNYAGAERALRQALAINPNYAEAHGNLGALYELQGRLDAAAAEFRLAIAAQPDYPLARFRLGRILVNRNKYAEAIQQFLRALQPEDERTPAYTYALAATYARAGERAQALAYFRKARDAAAVYGQGELLKSIERDLETLAHEP